MVLCDVSLDDHEHKDHDISKVKLISAKYVNTTAILFKFDNKLDEKNTVPDVEISMDNEQWITYKLMPGGVLKEMKPDFKYARIENTDDVVNIQNSDSNIKTDAKKDDSPKSCVDSGKTYSIGVYDNRLFFSRRYYLYLDSVLISSSLSLKIVNYLLNCYNLYIY